MKFTVDQYCVLLDGLEKCEDFEQYYAEKCDLPMWEKVEGKPNEREIRDVLESLYTAGTVTIQRIAEFAGYSVRGLGRRFGIPMRTIQGWAMDRDKVPFYVRLMMQEALGLLKFEIVWVAQKPGPKKKSEQ